jgi:hypothetical protein
MVSLPRRAHLLPLGRRSVRRPHVANQSGKNRSADAKSRSAPIGLRQGPICKFRFRKNRAHSNSEHWQPDRVTSPSPVSLDGSAQRVHAYADIRLSCRLSKIVCDSIRRPGRATGLRRVLHYYNGKPRPTAANARHHVLKERAVGHEVKIRPQLRDQFFDVQMLEVPTTRAASHETAGKIVHAFERPWQHTLDMGWSA